MKPLFYSFSLLAAVIAVAGCENFEKDLNVRSDCKTVLEVTSGEAPQETDSSTTRTSISSSLGGTRHVHWSEGDCLSLDGTTSEPLGKEYEGQTRAKFVWTGVSASGNLLYPASIRKDASTVTLPYSQDKMPGADDIATETLPMCGVAISGSAQMKHLCAIVRIQWTQKAAGQGEVCYLEFKGKNNEQVSGDFTIDYASATLTGISTTAESRYVRAYSMKSIGTDTSVCNIAVPAGTYSKGFSIRIVNKQGYYMDAYTSKSKNLVAGSVVSLPCFKYNPSTSKLNALTPASAGELIAIAKEWNAGRYEGGAANIRLASDIEFTAGQSAEWVEIGGLGSAEVPYKGTFDGYGFAIKNITSTIPFFNTVGPEGTLNNVKIDSSCVFNGATATIAAVLDGKMSGCTNLSDITFSSDLASPVLLGGLVCEARDGAVIDNCTNEGDVTLYTDKTGSGHTATATAGGIAACCSGKVTISNSGNSGKIFCNYPTSTRVDNRASRIGGIVGSVEGAGTSISDCNNSGAIYNTNWNNSANLDGPVSGGIAAVIAGTDGNPVTVTGCKVLGPELMQTQRGIQGGIVGYMTNTAVSDCYYSKNNTGVSNNIPAFSGGICGKSYNSTISECTVEDALLASKTTLTTSVGGICGWMDSSSKMLNNSALRLKITRNGTANFSFGGITGSVEASSSEISGNSFSGKYSTDSGSSWTSFNAANVCGSTSFTVNSPNTLVETASDLSGTVICGSTPLEGVVVTDGYQSVKTDANGRFHLTTTPSKVRYVSVCIPEGYGAPRTNGLPKFFVKTSGEAKDDIVFNLRKLNNPSRFTLFVTADPQQRARTALSDVFAYHSGTVVNDVYKSLGARAAAISDREVYGIVLGDVVHQDMDLYSTHCTSISSNCASMSTYHIMGNHDYNPDAKEIVSGMAYFEKYFGPANYSMNIGKFHFVMLNDIQAKLDSSNKLTDYDQGLSDDQIAWLESDLQFVPTSTPLIVCAHAPMFAKHSSSNKKVTYSETGALNGAQYKEIFGRYSKVYVLGGHNHHNFTFVYSKEKSYESTLKGVECIQLARCGGALWLNDYINTDGSPRCYLQMEINGTSISWQLFNDVQQNAVFVGKYGSSFNYPAPSYDYRDWNYTSGIPILKSNETAVDANYQMKTFANQGDTLWANIFLWDVNWGTPVVKYTNSSGGTVSVNMTKRALSDGPQDFAYIYYNNYYTEKNKYWKQYAGTDPDYCPHLFYCLRPADCPSKIATVTVTDRFGNVYTSEVKW